MSGDATKKLVRLSDVSERPIDWLWPNRLAAGKLSLLDGDPDRGKSLITLDWAARLTTGRAMPDGYEPPEPCAVVLLGRECEDDAADTVTPRLRAAGADLSRVHRLEARVADDGSELPISFPRDGELLRETLRETHARLVILDPFAAFLDDTVACLNGPMARRVLDPLMRIAKEGRAAIALVRHLAKAGLHAPALYRGLGAVGIIGQARTAFLVGRDRDDPSLHFLATNKHNLSEPPPTLAYRLRKNAEGLPIIDWQGASPVTAEELVLPNGERFGQSVEKAAVFLHEALHAATRRRDAVRAEAAAQGIAGRTLERAKQRLRIVSVQIREDGRNVWYWRLPGEEAVRAEQEQLMEEIWAAGDKKCGQGASEPAA
jgi:hypothetical protein